MKLPRRRARSSEKYISVEEALRRLDAWLGSTAWLRFLRGEFPWDAEDEAAWKHAMNGDEATRRERVRQFWRDFEEHHTLDGGDLLDARRATVKRRLRALDASFVGPVVGVLVRAAEDARDDAREAALERGVTAEADIYRTATRALDALEPIAPHLGRVGVEFRSHVAELRRLVEPLALAADPNALPEKNRRAKHRPTVPWLSKTRSNLRRLGVHGRAADDLLRCLGLQARTPRRRVQ